MSSTAQQKPETRGGEDAVRFHCRAFSGGGRVKHPDSPEGAGQPLVGGHKAITPVLALKLLRG